MWLTQPLSSLHVSCLSKDLCSDIDREVTLMIAQCVPGLSWEQLHHLSMWIKLLLPLVSYNF